jgi:Ser/Thr protein kinase RdoA (MazF antagonist)
MKMNNTIQRDRSALYQLVSESLVFWPVPDDAVIELINISENATFLVSAASGFKTVLRVHRPDYHDEATIAAELSWMAALRSSDHSPGIIQTPAIIPGRDGALIQRHQITGQPPHHMVMFAFVEGIEPDQNQPLDILFHHLGGLSAQLHLHVQHWPLPDGFTRPHWDIDGIFGQIKRWGDWRQAPHLTTSMHQTLEKTELFISQELTRYGKSAERYGLIHADMRLANLLVAGNDMRHVHVIDFDDCGFGWFMYDFAAGISFIEDDLQIPQLKSAWLAGYQEHRSLSDEDIQMIDTMVMLRRMLLLAWVGSHKDADIVADLETDFGRITTMLAERYLSDAANSI